MSLKREIPIRQLYTKAYSLKLPKPLVKEFIHLVLKWEQSSGIDWTVERLKSIKLDLINFYSSSTLPKTKWVAKSKNGTFSGVLGHLFKLSLQSYKSFIRVLTLINCYTMYTFDEPRPDIEIKKFKEAVLQPETSDLSKYQEMIAKAGQRYRNYKPIRVNTPFELELTTPNREERFMLEPYNFFKTPRGIVTFHKFQSLLDQSLFNFIPRGRATKRALLEAWDGEAYPEIGNIHCTPNPGLKARFFASPHLWLQHVLKPLGEAIYDLVNSLPWDATFNQNLADKHIINTLSQGNIVSSFDLSSATDRFPFSLQLTAIKNIFLDKTAVEAISFYEYIQQLPYILNGEKVAWARGQALGMYPSFGVFTLSHGLMLYALNDFNHDDQYFVLGDDVIILNETLAERYRTFLIECDIPYSEPKTLKSNKIAEFSGHIYSSTVKSRVPKWKPINKANVVDQISQWGVSIIDLVPKKYRETLLKISALPQPYGCGLNPKGLSLDARFEKVEEILIPKEEEFEYFTNFKQMVLNRTINGPVLLYSLNFTSFMSSAEDLDQRIQQSFNDLINLGIPSRIFGKNIWYMTRYYSDVYDECHFMDIPLKDRSKATSSTNWSPRVNRIYDLITQGES